jgi:hypothetical protein
MAEEGLGFQSLSDIAGHMRPKAVSPVELARTLLDRLGHLNPRLDAFMTVLGEEALEPVKRAEQELAAGQPRGPLHGVPPGPQRHLRHARCTGRWWLEGVGQVDSRPRRHEGTSVQQALLSLVLARAMPGLGRAQYAHLQGSRS